MLSTVLRHLTLGTSLFLCACASDQTSAQSKAEQPSSYFTEHERFDDFVREAKEEYQIPETRVRTWLAKANKRDSILRSIKRPAEKTVHWDTYQTIFLTQKRINKGKAFLKTHQKTLEKAEKMYGVPKEIITAILGVETFYGHNQGKHPILDTLATLAFEYPKRPLFWRELKALFALAEKESLDIGTLKSSYAGALGYGQFIPTSYLNYAVDGDGDGKRDLLGNVDDAIMSVANYFKRHGWKTGTPVAILSTLKAKEEPSGVNQSLKPKRPLAELEKQGIALNTEVDDKTLNTALFKLKGKKGDEYWTGFQNFYVITRYNHSRLYAMAVFQLSEAVR